ncbi:MAG: methionine--tRNA ligase [Candidatus Hermodarchaeota archaeon]
MEIKYEEFLKLDIRVGLVKNCEKIENSKNLYKLQVDCGDLGIRQILTGIASYYSPDELINEKIVVLTNLKSRTMMGFESQGMLLAADFDNEPFLLKIDERRGKIIPPGSKIK